VVELKSGQSVRCHLYQPPQGSIPLTDQSRPVSIDGPEP